jgi:hypothetical protein
MSESRLDSVTAQLLWVSDVLIPSDPQLNAPSATDAGVVSTWLPRALKARQDLLAPFVAALSDLPADPPVDGLAVLMALPAEQFDLISHLVAGAYFLNPDINRSLKYPGQEALKIDPDYEEIEAVVLRVMKRGPVYLDV